MFDSALQAIGEPENPAVRRAFLRQMVGRSLDADFALTWEYRESAQELLRKLAHRPAVPNRAAEVWFRRILTREPTAKELELCRGKSDQAIVFALVMGSEFAFNH